MPKRSAGLLIYRKTPGGIEVLLVHPGGPFWAKKDEGAWSIPKGEVEEDEDLMEATKREFNEETGLIFEGRLQSLGSLRQPSGKVIYAWAGEGEIDASVLQSNTFSLEWPPGSGNIREFPEVDRAGWFTIGAAREKISKGQAAFLDQLESKIT